MVLAQRQKYRKMEQNRKPRDKSMYLQTPYLQQRRQEYTVEVTNTFKGLDLVGKVPEELWMEVHNTV